MKDEKRDRFIKVMLTEGEYKDIERFSHIEFMNKSEFIRESVKKSIYQIKDEILPHKQDRIKDGRIKKEIFKEAKMAISAHANNKYLEKSNKEDLKLHQKMIYKRKQEIENELEEIRKSLK